MKRLILCTALAMAGSVSFAQLTFDFEGITDISELEALGWEFTDGSNAQNTILIENTIVHGGSGALRLNINDLASYPLDGAYGTLELWIYDFGYLIQTYFPTGSCYGPTFGLQKSYSGDWTYPGGATATYEYTYGIGAGLVNKTYLGSDGGFAADFGTTASITKAMQDQVDAGTGAWTEQEILDSQANDGWGTQSWFSPSWLGGGSPNNSWWRIEGWNHFRISYTADGLVEVNLLENPDASRTNLQQIHDANDPGETLVMNVFDGTYGGGLRNIFIWGGSTSVGEWTEGGVIKDENYFGDIIVDDIIWTPVGGPDPLDGDANLDDTVDIQDFVILKQNYGKTGGAVWGEGDFSGDGNVDIQDFVILKQNYGTSR